MIAGLCAAVTAVLAAPPDAATLFERLQEARADVEVVEAKFTETSTLPDEVLTTSGSLLYARPRRIIYRTKDPERTTLAEREFGYEYEPDLKQLIIYDLRDQPQVDAFFLGFHDDLRALREAYTVSTFATPDKQAGNVGVRLKPKAEEAADAFFLKARIFLREKDLLPYRIHVQNETNTFTTIDIDQESVVINGNPPPERTQIFLPEGTDIIRKGEPWRTVSEGGEHLPDPITFDDEPPAVEVEKLPPRNQQEAPEGQPEPAGQPGS